MRDARLIGFMIHAAARIVPGGLRDDWKREWNAEIEHYSVRLDTWQRARAALFFRALGAWADACVLRFDYLRSGAWADVRYGARQLRRTPVFTAIAVAALGLGIGVNTTLYSVVDSMMLRPLAVPAPERIAAVYTSSYNGQRFNSNAWLDLEEIRGNARSVEDLAAFTESPVTLIGDTGGIRLSAEFVSARYFDLLGVPPLMGRVFSSDSDSSVVMSYDCWQRRFGRDVTVIGRALNINGKPLTVAGITRPGFTGARMEVATDLWVPLRQFAALHPGHWDIFSREARTFEAVVRLRSGATLAALQAELRGIGANLAQAYPQHWRDFREQPRLFTAVSERDARFDPDARGEIRMFIGILGGIAAFVLLIVCANLANMLLARAGARRREMSIRLSIGAPRVRLVRQMLTESSLLTLLGGAAGLMMTWWAIGAIKALEFTSLGTSIVFRGAVDARVLAFTAMATVITTMLFGLIPALHGSRAAVAACWTDASLAQGARAGRSRLARSLVVFQLALSLMLLTGALLAIRSLRNMQSVDPGFGTTNLAVARMDLRSGGYSGDTSTAVRQKILDRVSTLPGVVAAAYTGTLPLSLNTPRRGLQIEGYARQRGESMSVYYHVVTPEYFATFGIPVLRGRGFGAEDRAQSRPVALVNEAMAARYWPGQDPIGRKIASGEIAYEVIGVVRNTRFISLRDDPKPLFYLALPQAEQPAVTLVVRTTVPPSHLLQSIRREIASVDPNLPAYNLATFEQHAALKLLPARLAGTALAVFGVIATMLASMGVFGVVSYWVSQSTHDIGIRIALGGTRAGILRWVLADAARLALIAAAIGVTGAAFACAALAPWLYGIHPRDPLTFAAVAALLIVVTLVAAYLPARRAAGLDPVAALRID